ncbi:short chain dehydrogenase [Lentzea albidocapillata]|uniref:Short chain dehydrogenase n=1 Tax=Lentzea albidocapillata TaxID=40571 RepID=A0A1W2C401_9PSEU|nr:short chain dehydrogenase [Lentzea albidocapillata]
MSATVVISDWHERRLKETHEALGTDHAVPCDVTLKGTFRCARAALRQMVVQRSGVVVNNSSVIGRRAQKGQAHYAAAKAGVMALTRCAAMDVAEHGIRVNAVAPSLAAHPFLAKVISEELLTELAVSRGFRARRRALGGRECDRVPRERLLVVPDGRGRLGEQSASVRKGTTDE